MEIVHMVMMMCTTLEVCMNYMERDINVLLRNRTVKLRKRNCFVYKRITCPVWDDILDVYSKLEKCIMVLADLAEIFIMAWYLC